MLQRHEKDPLFVSPLCRRVSPFKTLHALCLSALCQRVTLYSIILNIMSTTGLLSLLAILWNSAFRCLYQSFPPLLFTSLLFTAICKASPGSHFVFCIFFPWGWLISVSYTMSETSIHSSSGTLSDLVPLIYFSLPLYNHKGFDLGHT